VLLLLLAVVVSDDELAVDVGTGVGLEGEKREGMARRLLVLGGAAGRFDDGEPEGVEEEARIGSFELRFGGIGGVLFLRGAVAVLLLVLAFLLIEVDRDNIEGRGRGALALMDDGDSQISIAVSSER
jgi:hypothetical protein